MAALSIEGELIGSAIIEGGSAIIEFDPLQNVATADIVVTAFNYRPYIATIDIIPADGPYIVYVNHVVKDESGNNNDQIDSGETIMFDFTVENVGTEDADVEVMITIDNQYITLVDSVENFGMVSADGEVTKTNAFSFTVANNIPDQTTLIFAMTATVVDRENFVSTFNDIANAPVMEIEFIRIDDASGNNNGRLDAGETANLIYHAKNSGHVTSSDAVMGLASSSEYITVNTSSVDLGVIESAGYVEVSYEIVTAGNAPVGVLANFSTDLVADTYTALSSMMLPIGLVVEDFETGDFTAFEWTFSGSSDWEIIEGADVYEGIYSAKSGAIGDNQSTGLEIIVDVPMDDVVSFYKKVSSESGYDKLKFYIDGTEKGSWDGTVAWSFEEFDITAGEHTLKWEYEKDANTIGGSDCAWLDFIVLPGVGLAPLFADFTSDIQNVYDNPEVHFSSNSIGDITGYSWTFEGGEPETSDEENPTVSYNVPGVYSVSLTVTDGTNENTITKEDFITVYYWVGMAENKLDESTVNAYPNPFYDKVSISLKLEKAASVTVELYDITGRIVKTLAKEELSTGDHIFKWDASTMEPGLYFYTVRTGNEMMTQKLILSR